MVQVPEQARTKVVRVPEKTKKHMVDLWNTGFCSVSGIARVTGFSDMTVRKYLIRAGVYKVRDNSSDNTTE